MLYVDIPTLPEIQKLVAERGEACVSVYLETTPLSQETDAMRIAFGNLAREAAEKLDAAGVDKRQRAALMEHLGDLEEDDGFWRLQANSLAVLATPEQVRTFRLANKLTSMTAVSDRFHLKPLLRAVTFPHTAFVLALSENAVRLIEVDADLPPREIKVRDLPEDAASAVGRSTLNDRAPKGRIQGDEGQKVRFRQYLRLVDAAIRPVLSGRDTPLILAATDPLASLFRSLCTYPRLLEGGILNSPDRMSEGELAAAARPVLDKAYEDELADIAALYRQRARNGRATGDVASAARAATFGAIDTLLVDIDSVVPGRIDEETGAVTFAKAGEPGSYGIVDEIAGRALASGARVLGVRKGDLPDGGELAAILRYAL